MVVFWDPYSLSRLEESIIKPKEPFDLTMMRFEMRLKSRPPHSVKYDL
jgi:hypothetical protein